MCLSRLKHFFGLANRVQRTSGLPNPPRSARPGATNSVFVVHGHDQGLTTAVARYLEKLKLKANILHERGNPGATIIEKFEAASDVDFAVVLATGDDLFTSPATNAGARQRPRSGQDKT